jgi:hypothetical protein
VTRLSTTRTRIPFGAALDGRLELRLECRAFFLPILTPSE